MTHAKTTSVFFLFFAFGCVIWSLYLPYNSGLGYLMLAGLMMLSLFVGFSDEKILPLSLMVLIPVVSKLTSVTLAPTNAAAQLLILTSVMFSLGFSYAYRIIQWKFILPGIRHITPAIIFILLSVSVGIAAGFATAPTGVIGIQPWIARIILIIYITVSEELTFRGAILAHTKKILHPVVAAVLTSLLYGTLYISFSPFPFAIAFLASLGACSLYFKTHRLWPVVVYTFVWKLISVVIMTNGV